ncbi:hypothetical protein ACOSQ2_031695 [Xanthoceras sorbifolium]
MTTSNPTVASSSSTSAPQVTLTGTTNNNTYQSTSLIAINSTQVPIKLSKGDNYAAWKSQFENLLFGYDLMGYLDGTTPCPSISISVSTDTTNGQEPDQVATSPARQIWLRQDRLLLHAIQVSCMATYANRSNTRKLGLLDSLTNVSLEDKSVADYMLGIKSIIDNLELIGHSVDDGALVIHTLNGLSSAYMPLASAVRARDTPISFEELYDKLLDHEAYLRREASKKFGTQITAQFNQRSLNRRGHGQHGNFSPTGQHHQFGSQNSLSYSSPSGQHLSNNRGTNSTHHNNYRTHNQPHAAHQSQQWRPPNSQGSSRPICQLCDKFGHTARTCRSQSNPTAPTWPQANHMTSDQSSSRNANNWILDSGASHHMTSDLQNLSLHSEYGGPEDIMLGDGKSIPITHIGSTLLHNHDQSFRLKHVLCSPKISHNLVFVSQFCTHNHASIEFFPDHFLVKDLTTGASLVRGQNKENLYVWPSSSHLRQPASKVCLHSASVNPVTSQHEWHCRLGHPSAPALQRLIQSHNLPVTKSRSQFSSCSACHCNKVIDYHLVNHL